MSSISPDIDLTAQLGELNQLLGFRLRRIQNQLSKTLVARLALVPGAAGGPVKTGQFSALALIAANPGISQIQLARTGGIDKTAVVAMVDDMEARGWAVRRRAPDDRRRHTLNVTADGEAMLADLARIAQANEARIRHALSAQELQRLYAALDKIYELCFADEAP